MDHFKQEELQMDSDNSNLSVFTSKQFHSLPIWNWQRGELYHMPPTERIESKMQSLATPLLLEELYLLCI